MQTPSTVRPASPAWPLVLGAALIFLTFMRYGIGALGWVVFAPFLYWLHRHATRGPHVAVWAALTVAWLAAIAKMATSEISWIPVPVFAIPIAAAYFVACAVAAAADRRLGVRWGIYAFPAMAVVLGWIQYDFTEGSSWGVLAHTQIDNLPLVQLGSLTGIAGITALVALGSSLAAAAWSAGIRAVRADLMVFALIVGGALVYGEGRLARPAPGPQVRVGAVVSPVTHQEFGPAFADIDTLRAYDDELFSRSASAVDRGARIVVWNEVATFVSPAGEAALTSRGQALAKARDVMLVMAYGVADSMRPFHYVNKYRVYLPDGTLADEYQKRHPVPGDPNDKSARHAKVVLFDGARLTGAICYDYGFPAIALDNAADGAEVVLVPASDWRGIDPQHGRMALMNAVAVGLPIVRPVRAATSFMSDQYGRVLSAIRADGATDGVMVASVPAERVPTLYARTGEVLPLAALAFCVLVIGRLALLHQPQHA